MYAFDYHRPQSVTEAAKLLCVEPEAKLLAGGHTLLPTMKQRLASPKVIIDLSRVAELKGIDKRGNNLVIGAMTTHDEVATSAVVKGAIAGLTEVAAGVGDPQVRNRGTIGGSVANNDPAADYPAALLALAASIGTNKREISADAFFKGLFATALDDGEIITRISFPVPAKFAYVKFANPASKYALVGVAVAQTGKEARVAVTGAGNNGAFRMAAWRGARQELVGASAGRNLDQAGRHDERHACRCRLSRASRRRAGRAGGGQSGVACPLAALVACGDGFAMTRGVRVGGMLRRLRRLLPHPGLSSLQEWGEGGHGDCHGHDDVGGVRAAGGQGNRMAGLNDPETLKASIPGCESLEKLSDTEMKAVGQGQDRPHRARFKGEVHLSDIEPPNGYRIGGEGQGGVAGFAKGGAKVRLDDAAAAARCSLRRRRPGRRQDRPARLPADRRPRQASSPASSSPTSPRRCRLEAGPIADGPAERPSRVSRSDTRQVSEKASCLGAIAAMFPR